jgi:hypothetical protein
MSARPLVPAAGGRRVLAAVALPTTVVALLASTLLDPLDDFGPLPAQVAVARAVPGTITALGLVELLTAVLFGTAVLSLVSLLGRRGAVLGTVTGVVGVLGVAGLTAIGVSHLVLAAAAGVTPAHAAAVVDRFHSEAAAMLPLFFAAPVALPLLGVTAARARLAPTWTVWLLVAFFVLDLLPLPGGELIPLGVALVASVGIAVRLARSGAVGRLDEPSTVGEPAAV